MNMSSSRSVKIVFKAVEGTLKNSQVEVKKMLSLKEVEFQFWEKFSQFDDDDDNDNGKKSLVETFKQFILIYLLTSSQTM